MKTALIISFSAILVACNSIEKKQEENTSYEIELFQDVANVYKTKESKVEYKGHNLLTIEDVPEAVEIAEYDLGNDGEKEIIVAYTLDDIDAVVTIFSGKNFNKITEITNSTAIKLKDGNILFERYHIDNTEQNVYALDGNELKWIDEVIVDVK